MAEAFDPHPAAAMLAQAWRSGTLLAELPRAVRPATMAQGYDIQGPVHRRARPRLPSAPARR